MEVPATTELEATIANVLPGKLDWCAIWMMHVHPTLAELQTQFVKLVSSMDPTNAVVLLVTLATIATKTLTSVKKVIRMMIQRQKGSNKIWAYFKSNFNLIELSDF